MANYICVTCGHQYKETDSPPEHCLICEDERQYIGHKGQLWTTISEMQKTFQNRIEDIEANLTGIGTVPAFAIGQRALLAQTPNGNVLWIVSACWTMQLLKLSVHAADRGNCSFTSSPCWVFDGMESCL
jgi:hypothetical protein